MAFFSRTFFSFSSFHKVSAHNKFPHKSINKYIGHLASPTPEEHIKSYQFYYAVCGPLLCMVQSYNKEGKKKLPSAK